MIVSAMLTKTADEWLDVFQEKGVAADKIISTQQAMDHPVVLHNGGVVEIDDPAAGATQQIGPLIKFSRHAVGHRRARAAARRARHRAAARPALPSRRRWTARRRPRRPSKA